MSSYIEAKSLWQTEKERGTYIASIEAEQKE
jgi:hypothetical protein